MPTVSLAGPYLKIERANRHIAELESEIEAFFAKKPYRIVVEDNGTGNHGADFPLKWVVRVSEELPLQFVAIIGDAVHNLRSALDLLTCALVRANGESDERVQFPIARDAPHLPEVIKQHHVDRASPQMIAFISSLNPHRGNGGNAAICAIHDLDILDKHRLIIAVSNIAQINRIVVGLRGNSMMGARPNFPFARLKDGEVLVSTLADLNTAIGEEIEATYQVVFGIGQPLAGDAVIPTLRLISNYVESVIKTVTSP